MLLCEFIHPVKRSQNRADTIKDCKSRRNKIDEQKRTKTKRRESRCGQFPKKEVLSSLYLTLVILYMFRIFICRSMKTRTNEGGVRQLVVHQNYLPYFLILLLTKSWRYSSTMPLPRCSHSCRFAVAFFRYAAVSAPNNLISWNRVANGMMWWSKNDISF